MNKKVLFLLALLTVILTLTLSGCGKQEQDLDGKYIVTFALNGGKLNVKTSDVSGEIYYAYDPGSYMIDPSDFNGYTLTRNGYDFTGWYKSEACLPEERWDFKSEPINSEKLTLYAGWAEKISYTFTVCYADGETEVTLGSYSVEAGEHFEDYRSYATARKGYTVNGFYSDPECLVPWDRTVAHPGGETDTDVRVYVKYIEGTWKLAGNYAELNSALRSGGNVYLTANVDCEGKTLPCSANGKTFSGIFEGNGYTVSNLKVEAYGTLAARVCAIFNAIGSGSEVRNVSFTDVELNLPQSAINETLTKSVKVAALAKEGSDCTIENVSVSGKMVTDTNLTFPQLQEAFYENGENATITDFTAQIAVETQP